MGHIGRMTLLPFVLLIALVGFVPTTANAADMDSAPAASVAAQRLLKGPWEMHEQGFTSKGTCESRRAVFDQQYGGYWIGGVAESRCSSYKIPACPTSVTKWKIDARTWFSENGPFRIGAVVGRDALGAVAAAC